MRKLIWMCNKFKKGKLKNDYIRGNIEVAPIAYKAFENNF